MSFRLGTALRPSTEKRMHIELAIWLQLPTRRMNCWLGDREGSVGHHVEKKPMWSSRMSWWIA